MSKLNPKVLFYQYSTHDAFNIYSVTVCPSSETIFRYIDTMTRRVKPGVRGKHAPFLSVIQGIWYRLISLLKFRHRGLNDNYGPYEMSRISVHLDQLVKRGFAHQRKVSPKAMARIPRHSKTSLQLAGKGPCGRLSTPCLGTASYSNY